MDDIVKQALRKWPNVPHCYGWLGLDSRGQWYLRDAQTQAQGSFAHARGERLQHTKLLAFIGRNYEADAQGCWFFQNGPQRVYVELEATPWVWRLHPGAAAVGQEGGLGGPLPLPIAVESHTGQPAGAVQRCCMDELGRVYLHCEAGLGLVHSHDVPLAAQALESGLWALDEEVDSAQLPQQYGFVLSPQALHEQIP